jgi:Domain of unknown function (DUF4332)
LKGVFPHGVSYLDRVWIDRRCAGRGAASKGRQALAEKTGIADADPQAGQPGRPVPRIKRIGAQYSDLLEAAGVDTVVELAQRNAAHLH